MPIIMLIIRQIGAVNHEAVTAWTGRSFLHPAVPVERISFLHRDPRAIHRGIFGGVVCLAVVVELQGCREYVATVGARMLAGRRQVLRA